MTEIQKRIETDGKKVRISKELEKELRWMVTQEYVDQLIAFHLTGAGQIFTGGRL